MEQIRDEIGISRNNPAILDVSARILTVEPMHESDEKHGEGLTILWNQFVLLDADQIIKVSDAKDDPETMGGWSEPSTPGEWGQYTVGGEKLYSDEVRRYAKTTCCFCFEPLKDVQQRPHKVVDRDDGFAKWYSEWREIDYRNIMNHRPHMMYWIDDFPKRKEEGRMKTKPPHVRLIDPAHFQSGCQLTTLGREKI
jgi:hypothetical protein